MQSTNAQTMTKILYDVKLPKRLRNFAGNERDYNSKGDRNFCALISNEDAADMEKEGWKVRYLKPRNEGDAPQPFISVKIKYRNRYGDPLNPPKIVLIPFRGSDEKQDITEETIDMLDWIDIEHVDIKISGKDWSDNGSSGANAYLASMFITMKQDELSKLYGDF